MSRGREREPITSTIECPECHEENEYTTMAYDLVKVKCEHCGAELSIDATPYHVRVLYGFKKEDSSTILN